jgi:hypothetical protein
MDGSMMTKKPKVTGDNGAVVWRGPSRFDGSPLAVVLTWTTQNAATGNMVQSWIVPDDPTWTGKVKDGQDRGACGDCPRAGGGTRDVDDEHGKHCYVVAANAPRAVAQRLDLYERLDLETASYRLRGRLLRIGSYGDPAMVPVSIWYELTKRTRGHTGYTHSPHLSPMLAPLVMASAENELQAVRLQAAGWRTYRVSDYGDTSRMDGEIVCPKAIEAMGDLMTCERCLKCDGAWGRSKQNIKIMDHSGIVVSMMKRREGVRSLPVIQSRGGAELARGAAV